MSYSKGTVVPVLHFVSILYADRCVHREAVKLLAERIGPFEHESQAFLFDFTDYYEAEMGSPLYRMFHVQGNLKSAEEMIPIKRACLDVEEKLKTGGNRTVNLDPGYLDLFKLVLASEKFRGHKIYLGNGICADLTLLLGRKTVESFPWTFPDFRSDRYYPFILDMRRVVQTLMRSQGIESQDGGVRES